MPTINTIPRDFKVSLLKNVPDYVGSVYSSKGVGEPPFYMGVSVYFAILDAINAARAHYGLKPQVIHPPLSVDKIRLACGDPIAEKVK